MGTPDTLKDQQAIILFDGVCNLCNASVQFVLKRDRHARFQFASLQSAIGTQLRLQHGLGTAVESIVLIQADKCLTKSDAALEIARHLNRLWPLCYGFKIIPRFLRDALYDLIARNRYRLFGKRDACLIPSPQWKKRFLD